MFTGGGAAASRPPVNSSESPGSRGKQQARLDEDDDQDPGSTAEANGPPSPSQYIGSMMWQAITVVAMTTPQHTGVV